MNMKRLILIGIINEAEIDKVIEIKDHNYISNVKFFYTPSEKWYSWRAETLSSYNKRIIYPMNNTSDILTFKTLNGARRNFIKRYLGE